jgi:hypothetical protein
LLLLSSSSSSSFIAFIRDIDNYTPDKNHLCRVNIVAAILYLQIVLHAMLCLIIRYSRNFKNTHLWHISSENQSLISTKLLTKCCLTATSICVCFTSNQTPTLFAHNQQVGFLHLSSTLVAFWKSDYCLCRTPDICTELSEVSWRQIYLRLYSKSHSLVMFWL